MRLAIIGFTLALTASVPLAATAQAPVQTQPLAQGEVLLEVNALGLVTTRADRASFSVTLSGNGADEAAARADVDGRLRELRTRLRALGIADADIRTQPIFSSPPMPYPVVTNSIEVDLNASVPAEAMNATATAQVEVIVRDIVHLPRVQTIMGEQRVFLGGTPTYALNDDSAPRGRARAQAIQKARASAEAYAASLDMRVVRVVRVTERLGLELFGLMANESALIGNIFSPAAMRGQGAEVPTVVVVGVDYALAPR